MNQRIPPSPEAVMHAHAVVDGPLYEALRTHLMAVCEYGNTAQGIEPGSEEAIRRETQMESAVLHYDELDQASRAAFALLTGTYIRPLEQAMVALTGFQVGGGS